MTGAAVDTAEGHRSKRRLALGAMLLAFAGFCALGVWQLERLQWKLALIQQVNERISAPAVDAPRPAEWPMFKAGENEYRHVRLTGRLLRDSVALVAATTELGQGFWVMTPLCGEDGAIRLVNLGFVTGEAAKLSPGRTDAKTAFLCNVQTHNPGDAITLTGLLRHSEPHGGFLRSNDATHDRWYSRDVTAIAAARGLHQVAPYFVDADGPGLNTPQPGTLEHPVGGLTVVSFHNNHLVYALTWFALALMLAFAGWKIRYASRRERKAIL